MDNTAPPAIAGPSAPDETGAGPPSEGKDKGSPKETGPSDFGWWFDSPISFYTAVIAIFTIGLFGVSIRTSRRQLRAYVFIIDTEFSWSKSNKQWAAQFSYRNSGATPAYDVVVKSALALRKVGDPEPTWEIDNKWPIGVIGPNGDKFWDEAYFDKPVPGYATLKAALATGSHEVFLFGRIDYVDEFDRPRWTAFRYSVGGVLGYEDSEMTACQDGNRTEKRTKRSQ